MKRKVKTKASHTTPRKSSKQRYSFSWQRVAVITTGLAMIVFFFTPVHQPVVTSVQGLSVMKGMYEQATISLPNVPGIKYYNIYYGSTADAGFPNAVRNVDPAIRDYLISYLKRGTTYHYKISGVNAEGAETYWTLTTTITNEQPM